MQRKKFGQPSFLLAYRSNSIMEGRMKTLQLSLLSSLVLFFFGSLAQASEKQVITAFTQVEAKGKGNAQAMRALTLVDQLDPNSIVPLLKGMNAANDLGDNWIRAAVSKILAQAEPGNFPTEEVSRFVMDKGIDIHISICIKVILNSLIFKKMRLHHGDICCSIL